MPTTPADLPPTIPADPPPTGADPGLPATGAPPKGGQDTTDVGRQAVDGAAEVKDHAVEQAGELKEEAKAQVKDVAGEARQHLGDVASTATTQLKEQAGEQATRIGGGLEGIGRQLSAMAEGSTESGVIPDLMGSLGNQVSDIATRLQDGSFDEVLDDVRRFARRRPGLFLLAAAGAGFAASRVVRLTDVDPSALQPDLSGGRKDEGAPTGSPSVGGSSTGGPSTGGPSTGGPSTGGPSTGGPSSGASSTGGSTTGGLSSGGLGIGDPARPGGAM